MLIAKCRKCGAQPQILYSYGKDYGWSKEDKAQVKCLSCGAVGRPVWGAAGSGRKSIIDMACVFWNQEQGQRW